MERFKIQIADLSFLQPLDMSLGSVWEPFGSNRSELILSVEFFDPN